METIQHRYQLLDALWAIQDAKGFIDKEDKKEIAEQLGISTVEVEGVITFYHFFSQQPIGKHVIYLNDSIVSRFSGLSKVQSAFEGAVGTVCGHMDLTEKFGLFPTSCIGLSDMEPAALIDFYPFTRLTPQKVHQIIFYLKAGKHPSEICDDPVSDIHYLPSPERRMMFRESEEGSALQAMKGYSPEEVIEAVKTGGLTGLGGAFFPTHFKWAACRKEPNHPKYIICNADEGEPGTFKDRVILQRLFGPMLEGMIIAGYAVGASEGVIYLRAEYRYLQEKLEQKIREFYEKNWLGNNILGIPDFNFDIRIQLGAGAYVCGAESALLQSLEGYRGEPRARAYFPTEKGYLDQPTVVNNVETFLAAARILEMGPEIVAALGTERSKGTKLLSVSGDCDKPGIYEIEWGMTLGELMKLCDAQDPHLVQVSGPSGELCTAADFDRRIAIEDLGCGGSVMVFKRERELMDILQNYNHFFVRESCGVCTPCRAGNFILSRSLRNLRRGLCDKSDLHDMREWSRIMQFSSRCGLGQTAPRSITQAMDKVPEVFEHLAHKDVLTNPNFSLERAVRDYDEIIRKQKQS